MTKILSDEHRAALKSHNLAHPIVRTGLAGMLHSALDEMYHVDVPREELERILDVWVKGINDKLELAEQMYAAGYRPGDWQRRR